MGKPVSVLDAAQYILEHTGRLTTWKLQKLCYYAQAWSLVWDEEPLFRERIEAWVNGPVVPALYQKHRGRFYISSIPGGNAARLDVDQQETVDVVLAAYGSKTARWLRGLTHSEFPWQEARQRAGLAIGERGQSEITLSSMQDYYSTLYAEQEK